MNQNNNTSLRYRRQQEQSTASAISTTTHTCETDTMQDESTPLSSVQPPQPPAKNAGALNQSSLLAGASNDRTSNQNKEGNKKKKKRTRVNTEHHVMICKRFVSKYSHHDMKINFEHNGIKTGQWLKNLKFNYKKQRLGSRNKAAIVALKELGFVFEASNEDVKNSGDIKNSGFDEAFFDKVQELTVFKEDNGHFNVPPRSGLHDWCEMARVMRNDGTLSGGDLDLLDAIGFPWTSHEGGIRSLIAFKKQFKHCDVPQTHQLHQYCQEVRRLKSEETLEHSQVSMLRAIGFQFEPIVRDPNAENTVNDSAGKSSELDPSHDSCDSSQSVHDRRKVTKKKKRNSKNKGACCDRTNSKHVYHSSNGDFGRTKRTNNKLGRSGRKNFNSNDSDNESDDALSKKVSNYSDSESTRESSIDETWEQVERRNELGRSDVFSDSQSDNDSHSNKKMEQEDKVRNKRYASARIKHHRDSRGLSDRESISNEVAKKDDADDLSCSSQEHEFDASCDSYSNSESIDALNEQLKLPSEVNAMLGESLPSAATKSDHDSSNNAGSPSPQANSSNENLLDEMNLKNKTVKDLQKLCKEHNIPIYGVKQAIIDRLIASVV